MVETRERPVPTVKEPTPWWKRPIVILTGLAAIAALVVVGILLAGGGGDNDEPAATTQPAVAEPIAAVQSWVAFMRAGDVDAMIAASPPGLPDDGFIEWQIGHQAKPEFTECQVTGESTNGAFVTCNVTYSDEYFFSRLLGEPASTTFSALVSPDGLVTVQGWPNPSGAALVIPDFKSWILANHPELEDTIFGSGFAGLAFTREGAEASMLYLDDYLAYQAAPPGVTPEIIMERLVAAVREVDPASYADLTYEDSLVAGREFLDWQVALGMDPTFDECERTTLLEGVAAVRCSATAGEDYFYSRLTGADDVASVYLDIRDNALDVTSWPPPPNVLSNERDFRNWIRDTHPEDEDRMFGALLGIFRFGTESGELHVQYLDEYLGYLATVPATPAEVMEQMTEAVREADPVQYAGITYVLDEAGTPFLEWNLAMGMDADFTDCALAPPESGATVICNVTMGENYFFSTVADANLPTVVLIGVDEGEMSVIAWPPPDGLLRIERSFRNWITANLPDQTEAMFGTDFGGVLRFSEEAGALHVEYADRYLAYLSSIEGLTAEDMVRRIQSAVVATDPEAFAGITYIGFDQDPAGKAFLDWQLALGMDPTFSDCAVTAVTGGTSSIACKVSMGPDHFHAIINGQDTPLDVFVQVDDGVLEVLGWPPTNELIEAEEGLRTWIQGMHPEDEAAMFGDVLGIFSFTPESAELHAQYLDEYLLFRALNG